MNFSVKTLVTAIVPVLTLTAAASCNVPDGSATSVDGISQSQSQAQGTADSMKKTVGTGCQSNDPHHICLGLHYVVYKNSNGVPVVDEKTVVSNMDQINRIWAQCDIGFQVENLDNVNPAQFNLAFGSESLNQLDPIRQAFYEKNTMLVVTTGDWGTTKNAWTAMPGSDMYGAILESSVGDYPNIIAHELGHYLSLDHVSNDQQVMNPIIYTYSTQLTSNECEAARQTAQSYWKNMIRS